MLDGDGRGGDDDFARRERLVAVNRRGTRSQALLTTPVPSLPRVPSSERFRSGKGDRQRYLVF